jgi:hypothetical protein
VVGSLVGITAIRAYSGFSRESGANLEFFEGYDENIFREHERICVVSEDALGMMQDGMLTVEVRSRGTHTNTVEVALRVVGIATGVKGSVVFAPFLTVSELGAGSDRMPPHTELIQAIVADNRQLDEFKETALRTFKDVGIYFNPQVFAMTIHDSEFYNITEVLQQTILFIDIATPIVYFMTVCFGFIASFMLTRRRKAEFAIMRSVGVNRFAIFFGALFEQSALCAIGVAAGSVLFSLTWGYVFIAQPLIFLICYVLGAIFSAARAAGTDVLRLLRAKE